MNALFLTAARFPIPHGFSTRAGGVSSGVHASLNLGWTVGDVAANVATNFQRLATLAAFDLAHLHTVSQVHGESVLDVSGRAATPMQTHGTADGLTTQDPQAVVAVKTADCIPLLLAAPDIRAVAAVHSGWRGTLSRIAGVAVANLIAKGADPKRMMAAVGPSIRRCCYEVSAELAGDFRSSFGARAIDQRTGAKPHLDLVFAVQSTLESVGVPSDQIEVLDACTSCDEARFFSHRRDAAANGGQKGLHLSFARPQFR